MFGHDNQQQQHDSSTPVHSDPAADGVLDSSQGAVTAPVITTDAPTVSDSSSSFLVTSNGAPDTPASVAAPTSTDSDTLSTSGTDDLLSIKQNALQQLSPLIGHLDQSPEEKFRTTMMMIQASDDQALIKDAYSAAQAITDEKVKAQALLDIVNEINYFTQQQSS